MLVCTQPAQEGVDYLHILLYFGFVAKSVDSNNVLSNTT